jgi:leucyl aminopeptidase (aminopeptidase T)
LFIEIYNCFESEEVPSYKELKEIIYWYASDYSDVFVADRIEEQLSPNCSFATDIVMNSDLSDLRYLYQYGEYISENEWKTAEHLNSLPQETIDKMAEVYTEGYRIGFENAGIDLSKKSVVNIRYVVGFERVIRKAIQNFAELNLRPTIYRAPVSVLTKKQQHKIGFYGGIANKQYEYDHRLDQGLILDKKLVERKLDVLKNAYEQWKELAGQFAGPAVMEVFGEEPFAPEQKDAAITLTEKQEQLSVLYDSKAGQLINQYIKGEERSFTIVAYPIPEIGENYAEIFNEVIRINTLDAALYEKVQQTLIDTLDKGEYVHILGKDSNVTDLKVQLYRLSNPEKETIFENCVADVNIPVGEVFTSPVLEGTNGVLYVSKVYLNELQYRDLKITFADGKITDYTCSNFEDEAECKKYIKGNVLYNHDTLPLGEFAIGTNTTAYVVAKKYGIEDKMPILIAEKMGPHFAVGDTCYSWSEENRLYNRNGKEIVAKDNSISILRKEDVSKAYFQCHTDITIPYEEIAEIAVVTKEGKRILLLQDGRFVLPGTEVLNEPLKMVDIPRGA